jgi:hydroxyacylglutathione hydrolase
MLHIHFIDMIHVQDNYNFLLHDDEENITAVIDPSESGGVVAALREKGWTLDFILNTHHHWDHTDGNMPLKEETGARVIGFVGDKARIPGIDIAVEEGQVVQLGASQAKILFVPGHTTGHIAFYFEQENALFCGDCLFCMGCGRMFEGTPQQFTKSLQQLAALPGATRVFCGHEYTIPNGRFARAMEPDNLAIGEAIERARSRRREKLPSVPTLLSDEKASNPFLRTHSEAIRTTLGLPNAEDWEIFAALRHAKDVF